MLPPKEIAARLAAQVERVCQLLLPSGKVEAGNWCAGSISGDKGGSLRVQLTGPKAGIWSDFANGSDKGDLLDLWAATKKVSLGTAIKEAKEWIGVRDPQPTNAPKKYFIPKFDVVVKTRLIPDTDVEKYLIGRGLKKETIHLFLVGQFDHPTIGRSIAFPSQNEKKDFVAVKYVSLKRTPEGKKQINSPAGQAPILWGWQNFPKGDRVAVICEGQIDAMTWSQWGVPALSIPNGTGDGTWVDYEWDNLARFDTIYLSYDMDPAGLEAVPKIAARLGIHRCLIVKLPMNDANECLMAGFTDGDAAKWLMAARPFSPKEIKEPKDYREKILENENPSDDKKNPGLRIPIFSKEFRFLPGETSLWTGHSFHGKSTFLNQVAIYAAMAGEGVAIGSFEVKGEVTVTKLAKCAAFTKSLTESVLDPCLDWLSGKIWIYDLFGIVTQEKLRELMLYSVMRHGVKHIIIDSLMKCDISSEDWEAQRKFLNELIGFAHQHDIHLHVVAHPRKFDDDSKAPEMMDVLGGQSISGQPDNVFSVWRNSKKSDKRSDGQVSEEEEGKTPDTVVYVRKSRYLGDRFKQSLWFQRGCLRFTDKIEDGKPYYENFNIIQPVIDVSI